MASGRKISFSKKTQRTCASFNCKGRDLFTGLLGDDVTMECFFKRTHRSFSSIKHEKSTVKEPCNKSHIPKLSKKQ
jgi:uncharacterized protein YjhX (UPF0386 family)